LKRLIEVRGADSVPLDLVASLPALWKGLLYDDAACEAGYSLVAAWSPDEHEAAYDAIARSGLAARAAGRSVLELAREVVEIAAAGLQRLGDRDASGRDAATLLDPVRQQLARGKSPGQVVLERWEGDWQRSAERLIRDTRY
jgi:glutamate--cysteine ligase